MASATEAGQDTRNTSFTLAASPEFKAWLRGLAEHLRLDRSKAVDLALTELARSRGYDTPAPPRRGAQGPTKG